MDEFNKEVHNNLTEPTVQRLIGNDVSDRFEYWHNNTILISFQKDELKNIVEMYNKFSDRYK